MACFMCEEPRTATTNGVTVTIQGGDSMNCSPTSKRLRVARMVIRNGAATPAPSRFPVWRSAILFQPVSSRHAWNLALSKPGLQRRSVRGCWLQFNIEDGVRWSTSRAFLDPIRNRSNLSIATHAQASRISWTDAPHAVFITFRMVKSATPVRVAKCCYARANRLT